MKANDHQGVEQLRKGIGLQVLQTDKAFDAYWLKQRLLAAGLPDRAAQKLIGKPVTD